MTSDNLADRLHSISERISRVSIYLRTSKDIYDAGEDLWFKAYLLDSKSLMPFASDSTLYIQLIKSENDSVVWQDKYKIENGFSQGHIYLDATHKTGDYLLVAYSPHSFYRGPDEFHALRKIKIIGTDRQMDIDQNPKVSDDKSAAQEIQFDVFPEGGQLILERSNKLAYKATDFVGRPLKVKGMLLEDNIILKEFESVHDGMGYFSFVPKAGRKYQIKLEKPEYVGLYPLPEIYGNKLGLKLKANTLHNMTFDVYQSKGQKWQRVYLRAQTRGRVINIASGILKDSLEITLPTNDFPQGISEVTLFNENLEPMAERLVYLHLNRKLNIKAEVDKELYHTREKVRLKIRTTDENGEPIPANLGISIYDRLFRVEEDSKDILTHYHLSTQLKGRIYNPGYYFDQGNTNRDQALDLLLLTQGWRKYVWNENRLSDGISFDQSIITNGAEGKLSVLKKKKTTLPHKMVAIYNPLNKDQQRFEILDSLGKFLVGPKDFEMGRQIYIKHFGNGKERISVNVSDPFLIIDKARKKKKFSYPLFKLKEPDNEKLVADLWTTQNGIDLEEVSIIGEKNKVFRDKYIGKLDSLTKMDLNDHWVCEHGFLQNYREGYVHLIGSSPPYRVCSDTAHEKPIEGKNYKIVKYEDVGRNDGKWILTDLQQVTYHYPQFTEEELLNMHNLFMLKGYYPKRKFYQPNYSEHDDPFPDYRNSLLWNPKVITDNKGEATIEFYCSDINTQFIGVVEGTDGYGLLGKNEFRFFVKKEK